MSETEQLFLNKLDRVVELIKSKNISLVDELWGNGDFALVGSERGEICKTREDLHAKMRSLFSNPATFTFEWSERTVKVVGDAAWIFAAGDFVVSGAQGEVRRPYLLSCIFEKAGGHWWWRQFFGSEPA